MSQDNNLPSASSKPTDIPIIPPNGKSNLRLFNDLALFQFSCDSPPDALSKYLNKEKMDPNDVYNYSLANETIIYDWKKEEKEYEIQEQQSYVNYILEKIDKKYSSGFKDNPHAIHAQLSYNDYWNAGLNILNFFTNDDIDTVWIGNSSSDFRCHSIIKDRKRNMVFEYHIAYGKIDIFPLTGVMCYLEAYNPGLIHNEQWINLNLTLPAYDMIPIDKSNKHKYVEPQDLL